MSAETFETPDRLLSRPVQIAVIGAGGTGSQVADQLASLAATLSRLGHPGLSLVLYDFDEVSASNIGRQRFCAADVGLPKAQVLAHRLQLFYGIAVEARLAAFGEGPPCHPDLIVGCVDSASARREIAMAGIEWGSRAGLWLDCGNADNHGQVVLGGWAGGGPLPNVLQLFPELMSQTDEDEGPSCSLDEAVARQAWPCNRVAAQIAGDLLWSLFRHGRLTHHGSFFQLDPLRIQPIEVGNESWAMFGFEWEGLSGDTYMEAVAEAAETA